MLQACIALAEAHALGIVHRDLKPSNLFLAPRLDGTPLVKVLDFGIAKAPSAHDLALTSTAAILGSPRYMSPEQLRCARDVDARTDIWALGAILYELVSGRVPFPATSLTEAVMKVGMDAPEPLDVDPAYVRVVLRCLEKPVDRRYPDVAALAADLAPFAPAGAAQAALIAKLLHPTPIAEPAAPPIDPLAATASTERTERTAHTTLQGASGAMPTQASPQRRRWLGIAGGTGVLAAGAIALAVRGGSHAAAPPDAPIAVAVVPVDAAAIVVDAAAVVVVPADAMARVAAPADPAIALRTSLRAAAARHDWFAAYTAGRQLSRIGQLTSADDAVYAAATDSYIWAEAHLVFDAAKADDCATANAQAERIGAIKWSAELARAAVNCDVRVGRAAYASGEYARAFTLAKAALQLAATDQDALRLAASASCQLDDPSAPDYARRVHSARDPATKSCSF